MIGLLDDAILLPLGVLAAVRLIPKPLMDEFRAEAERRAERPVSRAAGAVIAVVWIAAAAALAWVLWP